MELRNVIARLGAQPGYRIFGCTTCQALQWIEVQNQGR